MYEKTSNSKRPEGQRGASGVGEGVGEGVRERFRLRSGGGCVVGCGRGVVSRAAGPGASSVRGLRWLASVGPAPVAAWATAMGWAMPTA